MKYASLLAVMALVPAWGQMVKPTAGALPPVNAVPAPSASRTAVPGTPTIGKAANSREAFRILESDFDDRLKMADPKSPMTILGMTRGLYLQGYGVVFTTELDLSAGVNPLFHPNVTAEDKVNTHNQKLKHLDVLRQQMRDMMALCAKNMDFLAPNDQVVVAVRLLYQGWEDKSGLPDQILMKADRRGAQTGDIKVEVQ